METLSYDEFFTKLGRVALKCGIVFDTILPGMPTLHAIDLAVAHLKEAQDILEDLERKLKQEYQEREKGKTLI